ncbi:MAG: glycosyltransferase family 9 protein [Flavobacteriaceae bacterium]|jgi:ADP-heptose:LPS heptosyltransferase|nr:glycosyltransferase family 9 protein [Flavobacteriaceae bacterium]
MKSESYKERILVFRFSAMGDAAMTVPVLREFAEQNPDVQLIIVSNQQFEPFFRQIPHSKFVGVDFSKYKGFVGLKILSIRLLKYKPTMVADLHNVIRTKILRFFLKLHIKKMAVLDKGRAEKKVLTRLNGKIRKPLRPMTERYADVFRNLSFGLELSHERHSVENKKIEGIGIAPFATYKEKTYPAERMRSLCLTLAKEGYPVYLFGGGEQETHLLKKWDILHPNIHSLAGIISFEEQIEFIASLPLMISMDSANMHIASLVGTRVVSVWGATHPFAGFLGYGQSLDDVVQAENLNCRPCSVFGNKPCFRKDWACMQEIPESRILNAISQILKKN